MPQSFKQKNATIGGGGWFDPLLGWRGCRKSLDIGGLMSVCASSLSGIFGRPFVKRFAICCRTVVCVSVCPVMSVCPVCDVGVLWPNGWMDQDETWHSGKPRPWPHCIRWGPSSHSPKLAQPPPFSAHISCGQMVGRIKMPLGEEVGLGPSDIVLGGDPAPPLRGSWVST